MATTSTATQHTSIISNHHLSSRKSSTLDEDIVHVVTNVYQIATHQPDE